MNTPRRVALIVESAVAPRRRVLAGVARYVHEHGPWAIYLKPFGVETVLGDWLGTWNGDGIIAAAAGFAFGAARGFGVPVVDVAGFRPDPHVPVVRADDTAVGRLGAEHLLERGFRHFGFVEYPYFWSTERRGGFAAAVTERGFACRVHRRTFPADRVGGPEAWEADQRQLVDWIRSLPKPVGVMASTDLLGQQLLEACQRAEAVVPGQVAVIGADNDELICNIAHPPLSSVIIDDEQRGYRAAGVLDAMMRGDAPPAPRVLIAPAGVVSRASTDVLAIDDPMLAAAVRFVRDHACEAIGVDDVVKSVPVSRSVLERRFRAGVGRSINGEIVRVRLNHAVDLLAATQLDLKVIARRAGFCSPSYMGALFRQHLGRTPGSYRDSGRRPRGELGRPATG